MTDASEPTLSPRALAMLVLEILEHAGSDEAELGPIGEALHRTARDGTRDAWRAAAAAIWANEPIFQMVDDTSGMRAQIRRAAFPTVFAAASASLVRCILGKPHVAALFGIDQGLIWIPDIAVRYLYYDLELGLDGVSAFWEDDPHVADMIGADEGAHGLWTRFLRWAATGQEIRRGWVAAPDFVGSYPATGLPATLPRLVEVRHALRQQRRAGAFIAAAAPALLPWTPAALPSLETLALRVQSAGQFGMSLQPWSVEAYYLQKRTDPQLALLVLLARTGLSSAVAALIEIVRQHLLQIAPAGRRSGRVLLIRVPQPFHYRTLALARRGDRLLCSVDGVAAILGWLGLVPEAFRPVPPLRKGWDYATLRGCGWQLLETTRRWIRVQGFQVDGDDLGITEAIAFPAGPIPVDIPEWPEPLAIAHDPPPSRIGMDLHGRW